MKEKSRIFSIILVLTILFSLIYLINDKSESYESSSDMVIAMNTIVSSVIYCDDGEFDEYLSDIETVVIELENQISWRIDSSDIAVLNDTGEVQNSLLAEIISKCIEVSVLSGGSFDVTIGELTQLWDIGGENEKLPTQEEISIAMQTSGYDKISIAEDSIILEKELSLDLGAIGKGLACDEIKSYLEETNVDGAIISVGGSILAYGSYDDSGEPWQIAVKNPRDENSYIGVLKLDEGFVSTSGDYERYFEVDGVRYHHILDANTGYPSDSDLISVTVVADSGLLSDALSTAIFACGSESADEILSYFGASAVLINVDLEVSVIGDIDFELLD